MPYAKKEKSGKDAYDKGDMKTGMKPRRSRKKVCPFCADKAEHIDYKEIAKCQDKLTELKKEYNKIESKKNTETDDDTKENPADLFPFPFEFDDELPFK